MDSSPSNQQKDQNAPEPEVLQAIAAEESVAKVGPPGTRPELKQTINKKPRQHSYRPSHKATFIGIGVVIAILAVNAVIFIFLLKKQAENDLEKKGQVSISTADLNKLGINRSQIGASDVELLVAPSAQFKNKLSVAGDTNISGQLILNNKLSGTDATLTQLQAGNTTLSQLNVNGDITANSLNLRRDLTVAGSTRLQGPVTLSQLLTVTNSINVVGNLAVGGTLTVNTFSARSLTSTGNLTAGGHIVTSGAAPSVSPGSALGSNGTVSISGNDIAGAVAINIGVGASGGTLANVTFKTAYGNIPRVVITPVGVGGNFYITNLTSGGFSIAVSSGLPAGGYRINYIAMQ